MILQTRPLIPVVAALFFAVFIHPLPALPDIKSNKSLGTWQQFVTSLGLQGKPDAAIYFDTDRLVAGEYVRNVNYDVFAKENRTQLRGNIGRIVKQKDGPEIVVYDFDEIYTALGAPDGSNLPHTIILFGRRPAAIVADGQISNWPYDYDGPGLEIYAYNSCDADDTGLTFDAGIGRGGDGLWVRDYGDPPYEDVYNDYFSGGGGGGYGTAGEKGSDSGPALGGAGGGAYFSWNILRPGSSGGRKYTYSDTGSIFLDQDSRGLGGGAVWIKSGGRLDLARLLAVGWSVEGGGGCGSGGHIVLESPETPQIGSINVSGGDPTYAHAAGLPMPEQHGGIGVVEFRGTPAPPRLTYLFGAKTYWIGSGKTPVGLPIGVNSLQNPYDVTAGAEWPTGWNADSKEPEYQIFPQPRPPVPTVTASAPRPFTNAQKFGVAASVTGRNIPAAVRYRVRPPGATFFGPWMAEQLPAGTTKTKSWQKEVTSRKQGRWQVEVVADDAKGGRSTGKVVEVLVDRIKPECYFPTHDAVTPTGQPGGYTIKVYAQDYDGSGVGTDASGPARLQYRLKRPNAKFGNWKQMPVGDKAQYADWPYVELNVPITLDPTVRGSWEVQVRAVDAAGNISDAESITIEQ